MLYSRKLQKESEVLENLLLKIVANPIDALVNANYLGVLAWAVILGIALKKSTPGTKLMPLMQYLRQYAGLSILLHLVF